MGSKAILKAILKKYWQIQATEAFFLISHFKTLETVVIGSQENKKDKTNPCEIYRYNLGSVIFNTSNP